MKAPPGWQERLDRLVAIYDRACAELLKVTGMREVIAQQKCRVAYRQIQALLAMRPPARATERANMFADLERQIALESARQRAAAPSNDNGQGAEQQERENNGICKV